MIEWTKDTSGLTLSDIEKHQPYKLEPHTFKPVKRLAWLRCSHCGLLTLRNELTAWATRMGCNAADHPDYRSRLRRLL